MGETGDKEGHAARMHGTGSLARGQLRTIFKSNYPKYKPGGGEKGTGPKPSGNATQRAIRPARKEKDQPLLNAFKFNTIFPTMMGDRRGGEPPAVTKKSKPWGLKETGSFSIPVLNEKDIVLTSEGDQACFIENTFKKVI